VAKQTHKILKMGLMVISLFVLAACSSTSDTEGDMSGSEGSSSSANSSGSSARSSAGSNSGQLSQEEIRAQNALRQTVFYFDFDIAEFKTEDRNTLTFHARDLASSPSKRIRLEGHADERGTREYNLALGENRALSVKEVLSLYNLDDRILVVSYGEESPILVGSNEMAWEENRRVEFSYY